MAELITLTQPILAVSGVDKFRLWHLSLRRNHPDRPAEIHVILREVDANGAFISGGKSFEHSWEGATAQTLLNALNKANLTSNTLEKRVMAQLQSDLVLGAGTISGTPD